ncbi:MAG TPA: endonuclease/exonuclease/phosphatase family protein [Bacteroidales bacterium]|nr:endonuclease/exonuclease/phosphatase family protein [Bacteroidales bacterium]
MRSFIGKILLSINVILAIWLIITYWSVHISPEKSWVFAFIGMSYPFVLAANFLFILFWIGFRKWFFIISLVCILLGWNTFRRFFQVQLKKPESLPTENIIRILSYNVRLFNYYQWHKDTSTWLKIIDYIHTEKPDIVCFQEFITLPGSSHDLASLKKKLAGLSYSHVNYTDRVPGKINFGMATFSKYPIVNKQLINFKNSLNGSICSDIVKGSDTLRIYNCHLQSIRLRKDYNDLIDSLFFNYSEKQLDELKELSVRVRQAFIQRAGQADILSRHIHSSPYPVIVCGDFNDTPVSYVYNKFNGRLNDAFIEAGAGTGTTIRGNFPYVRIDYVFYSAPFKARYYHTDKIDLSDHYPVIADFMIPGTADSTNLHSRPKE